MSSWLPWLIVLLIFGLLFWTLVRENDRKRSRSAEEFERDVVESRGSMLSAGALGLEKLLSSGKQASIECIQDEAKGLTKTGERGDDDHPGDR
ncbi:MAG: hypothetical protein ACREDR_10930 [Blastocatellia bacterium]